jgi:hypothetical protein
VILDGLLTASAKETVEAAMGTLAVVLSRALLLVAPIPGNEKRVQTAVNAIVKGISSTKIPLRQAWSAAFAKALLAQSSLPAETITNCLPTIIEAQLKTVQTIAKSPLAYAGGPLEVYVAVAVAERALNWHVSGVEPVLTKAGYETLIFKEGSVLFSEKVYGKILGTDAASWILIALEEIAVHGRTLSDKLGEQFASIFIPQFLGGNASERRQAAASLRHCTHANPRLVTSGMRRALDTWLIELASTKRTSPCENKLLLSYRFTTILTAATTFAPECEQQLVNDALIGFIFAAHHPIIRK